MNEGQLVFAQLMQHLPLTTFRRCVSRYAGERKVKSFSCLDQFLCMAFAQFTYRESLRDIEACLRAQQSKLYHLGIRSAAARNALANANPVRDWRISAVQFGDCERCTVTPGRCFRSGSSEAPRPAPPRSLRNGLTSGAISCPLGCV